MLDTSTNLNKDTHPGKGSNRGKPPDANRELPRAQPLANAGGSKAAEALAKPVAPGGKPTGNAHSPKAPAKPVAPNSPKALAKPVAHKCDHHGHASMTMVPAL